MAQQATEEVLRIGLTDSELDRIEDEGELTIETEEGTMQLSMIHSEKDEEADFTPSFTPETVESIRKGRLVTWDMVLDGGMKLEVASMVERSYFFSGNAAPVVEPQSFDEYLDEEVFAQGSYTYENTAGVYGESDLKVAEFHDGSGYIKENDLDAAVVDEHVELDSIKNGWLYLSDER